MDDELDEMEEREEDDETSDDETVPEDEDHVVRAVPENRMLVLSFTEISFPATVTGSCVGCMEEKEGDDEGMEEGRADVYCDNKESMQSNVSSMLLRSSPPTSNSSSPELC